MRLHHIALAISRLSSVLAAISPLGGGSWHAISPTFSEHQCAGGDVSGNQFILPKSPNGSTAGSGCSNGHLRAERRYKNDYSSGRHQFAGEFRINSMSGDRISLKQTFHANEGAYFMLAVASGGRLYRVGGDTLVDNVATVGQTVLIHTIHDAGERTLTVYINGKEIYQDNDAPSGAFYDKVGAYVTESGTGGINVTWSAVKFWTQN